MALSMHVFFAMMLGVFLCSSVSSVGLDLGAGKDFQLDELIAKHRHAVERNPKDGQAWALLAMSLQARDDAARDGGLSHEEIMLSFQKAITYQMDYVLPKPFWVTHNYAKFLTNIGHTSAAINQHTAALAHAENKGEKALGCFFRAACYHAMGMLDEAIADYTWTLDKYPQFYPAYLALTEVMMEHPSIPKDMWRDLLTTMTDARDGEGKAVGEEKSTDVSFPALTGSKTDLISAAERSLTTQFRSSVGDLHRAMHNAADRLKDFSLAFDLLQQANKLDEENYPVFDHMESLQRSLSIMKIFRDDNYLEGLGHTSDVPVFIVGMLRSGSSLFENVLGSHSRIVGIGEDSIFNGLLPVVISDISAVMKRSKTVEAVAEVIQYHAENILQRMLERAERIRKDQGFISEEPIRYIIDKMVFNFRNIGLIQLLFPYATIIHVIRDPMDTLLSCHSRRFEAESLGWTRNVDNLVSEYVMYLHIMQHFEGLYHGAVTHVIFEKLAANPKEEFKRIIEDVLGLDWEPTILSKNTRPRSLLANTRPNIGNEIDFSVVGKWRRYARQLQPMRKDIRLAILPLKTAGKLLFPDLINWELDPLFNYYTKYNVSDYGRGPKWVPDFEFKSGSGQRVTSPAHRSVISGTGILEISDPGSS